MSVAVGVVMPCYNQARWLPAALASIAAQRVSHRLVCVDDGSTDDTPKILAASGVPVVTHKVNQGTAAAINTGIAYLEEPGVAGAYSWVSSDNAMSPDWLSVLLPVIAAGAGAVYGGFHIIRHPEPPPLPRMQRRPRPCIFKEHQPDLLISEMNTYYGPAFLIRADVWEAAGPHRGRTAHDFDHWLRVEEACWEMDLPIVGVDLPLCSYNAHAESATARFPGQSDAPRWRAEAIKRRGCLK